MSNGVAKKPVLKKVSIKAIEARVESINDDLPFESNVETIESSLNDLYNDRNDSATASISPEFVGRWNQLISQTNWEKGRIIFQWREAAIAAGDDAMNYSDEVWSRQVEGVSPQHVGRLRRVFAKFGKDHESYPKLYWSHFLAAIDWDDAPLWLEGATQSSWSVSQMRKQRWTALGGDPASEPSSNDIVAVDYDDAFEPLSEAEDREASDRDDDSRISGGPLPEGPDFGDENSEYRDESNVETAEQTDAEILAEVNPFQGLPELPDDVAEAVEQMKLAIVRHRCRGWDEFSQSNMLLVIDACRKFAMHRDS